MSHNCVISARTIKLYLSALDRQKPSFVFEMWPNVLFLQLDGAHHRKKYNRPVALPDKIISTNCIFGDAIRLGDELYRITALRSNLEAHPTVQRQFRWIRAPFLATITLKCQNKALSIVETGRGMWVCPICQSTLPHHHVTSDPITWYTVLSTPRPPTSRKLPLHLARCQPAL